MALLLKGAPVSAALNAKTAEMAESLLHRGVQPALAIVRVGERPDDLSYERMAVRRAQAAGVHARCVALDAGTDTEALLAVIAQLNDDPSIHGILLLRPLPEQIDEARACAAIVPQKDVDGVTDGSLAGVFTGSGCGFAPCTAAACMEILRHYGIDPAGKRAVVVGRSLVVGRPLSMLLLHANATVTLCHTRTRDLPEICRAADILVAAAGRAQMLGAAHLRAGQTVLDVGIHVREDGSLCGDVAFAEAEPLVFAVTPVPGGVGTVTTAVLMRHVVRAAQRALT